MRPSRRVAPLALFITALALTTAARAQRTDAPPDGEAEQVALRARWRPTIDLGLRLSLNERVTVGGASLTEQDPLTPAASAGFAMYRALHPVFDLGARLGVVAPETSDEVGSGGSLTCPANYYLTRSGDLRVRGAALDLTVGLRVRVFGARTPFHVTVGAGLGLRAVATSDDGRWTCGRYDPGTGQWREAPARGEPRGFGVYPAFASQFGYEAHFGAREELGFGALVSLHDDGALSSSLVFRVMYTPSSGPSLPDAARSRGTRAAIWTFVGTGALVLTAAAVLYGASGGPRSG